MKKNQLTTTKSTALILGKSKILLGMTKMLLKNKAVATTPKGNALAEHKGITIIGDLMWEKETRGMTWHEVMAYAKNLRLGGYDDWRLPTKEELGEIVTLCGGELTTYGDDDYDEKTDSHWGNALYHDAFKAKGFESGCYWSSATYSGSSDNAWFVNFYSGSQYYSRKSHRNYVCCVRSRTVT